MQDKTVVFIAGSSYCGSTVLDLILSNRAEGFSLGEVSAYFYPYRSHHFITRCACGDDHCPTWQMLTDKVSAKDFHLRAFDKMPEVRCLVDSSKDPLWIARASAQLRAAGVRVHHVLLWKTPWQYHQSCASRGQEQGWERTWLNYYRLYLSLVDDWVSVRCADVVGEGAALPGLCRHLGIPFREDMHAYWQKRHHTLYGNHSARQHLYGADSDDYRQSQRIAARDKCNASQQNPSHQSLGQLQTGQALIPECALASERERLEKMTQLLQLRQLDPQHGSALMDPKLLRQLQVSEVWPWVKMAQRQVKSLRARWQHRRRQGDGRTAAVKV